VEIRKLDGTLAIHLNLPLIILCSSKPNESNGMTKKGSSREETGFHAEWCDFWQVQQVRYEDRVRTTIHSVVSPDQLALYLHNNPKIEQHRWRNGLVGWIQVHQVS
jgi:hypothetical protein